MYSKVKIFASFLLIASIFFSNTSTVFASLDEGMYMPDQIVKLPINIRGNKTKSADLYNPTNGGLSEAIVRVNISGGGFGTGEFVSPDGLILTNHHVGFDALVSASDVKNDYANKGYTATSRANELSAKDYNIQITLRSDDVTKEVLEGVTDSMSDDARKKAIEQNTKRIIDREQAKAAKGTVTRILPLNDGYYYYLFQTLTLEDIRVVYSPPKNIGFFGGDDDNFEWTRHTGDFMFLRAYVGKDGLPAKYSPQNVPFRPRKHLTISLNGVQDNEYTMVMGYPGGTTRYREHQAYTFAQNVNFPFLVDWLSNWSRFLTEIGKQNADKKVKLQGEIASLDNGRKAYQGGIQAMRRTEIISKRIEDEGKFKTWVEANPTRKEKYGDVITSFARFHTEFDKTAQRDTILRRFPTTAIGGQPMLILKSLIDAVQAVQAGKPMPDAYKKDLKEAFENRDSYLETEMLKFMLRKSASLPSAQKLSGVERIFGLLGENRIAAEESFARKTANDENFNSFEKIEKLYSMSLDSIKELNPQLVELAIFIGQEQAKYNSRIAKFNEDIGKSRLLYMKGMAEMKNKQLYPDANGTLRFNFGNVKGYKPREAVTYTPFTSLKGILEKDSGVEPFDVPQKLKDLYKAKDFG
ncbi:MAG: S46 family peptidase, partial [Pyrinomonadaceae bacterium]|nr:S46 family peptidase [Pyrinomonadaceae bacterium]